MSLSNHFDHPRIGFFGLPSLSLAAPSFLSKLAADDDDPKPKFTEAEANYLKDIDIAVDF